MLLAALAGVTLAAPAKFDFFAEKPYDSSIPNPEVTLGYKIGDRHTTFRDQERALQAIAGAAGKRVKVIEFGKSWEGRPLRLFVVSTPENMQRLEEIRANNEKRARGEWAGQNDPAMVWVNECIHGDETASFESAMPLVYNLAAARNSRMQAMLKNTVVLVNPVYNPDGHERYVVYYNSLATGSPEPGTFESFQPSTVYGRGNHYRFDMNRDRIAMSQQESRAEVAEFQKWHPQVYIDQHGQVETYFFPPNAMSQNANTDRDRVNKWTDIFGRATANAFDRNGWTYFVKDTFDLYYPGYLDSFTTLSGAIGMTHETDGGRLLARRRGDDTVLTLRDGVMKHFTSALAVIETAGARREDLLQSFVAFKKKNVDGSHAGKFQRVVMTGALRDLLKIAAQLTSCGVEVSFAKGSFKSESAHDYWSSSFGAQTFPNDSLVVDMAQPNGALAKALLEPGSDFEPEFLKAQLEKKKTAPEGEDYPGPEGSEFYDMTGWALPYAHNVKAWWCETAPKIDVQAGTLQRLKETGLRIIAGPVNSNFEKDSVGFVVPYESEADILDVAGVLASGVKGSLTTKAITIGGKTYPAGTFMFLAARNEPGYSDRLPFGAKTIKTSYPDTGRQGPGSESMLQLRKPNIAVVFGNGTNLGQSGAMWYLMDHVFHLPFTPLSAGALNGDLSKYTCIVVPEGSGVTATSKLREWVSNGGCVVALGGLNWATGSGGLGELDASRGDAQSLPGSIFRAELDPRSFLSYGYPAPAEGPITIAVPVEGSGFYKARKEGGSIVKFSADTKVKKLLSGWEWPDETEEELAGKVWLQDAPVGRGHAILFTYDPTSRAMWPGLHKLLLNAMILGPSA